MITLDWDNINYEEAARRIEQILTSSFVKVLELRTSPSLGGFHTYIETTPISEAFQIRVRQCWKDDGRRILGDIMAPKAIYRNVMFVYKSSPLGTLGEIPIVKYEKLPDKSIRVWHLSPRHQLPISLQELPLLHPSQRDSSYQQHPQRLT